MVCSISVKATNKCSLIDERLHGESYTKVRSRRSLAEDAGVNVDSFDDSLEARETTSLAVCSDVSRKVSSTDASGSVSGWETDDAPAKEASAIVL